jgi:L-rhamnose isomerase/sugar isomerase
MGKRMTTFDSIADQLAAQAIELPSWAFGTCGTRL